MKRTSVIQTLPMTRLAPYRARTRREDTWPSCAACCIWGPGGECYKAAPMWKVEMVDQGSRHATILGTCKVHGEQALRIDFEAAYTDAELSNAWRQLVFHESEVSR